MVPYRTIITNIVFMSAHQRTLVNHRAQDLLQSFLVHVLVVTAYVTFCVIVKMDLTKAKPLLAKAYNKGTWHVCMNGDIVFTPV